MKPRTQDRARGKWTGIHKALGIHERFLTGKHGPCPMCGGKDRFRYTNREGNGGFICQPCNNGTTGFDLLMKSHGWDFRTAAAEVDKVLGNGPLPAVKVKPERSAGDKLADCVRLWKGAEKITAGDPVSLYLAKRGCPLPQNGDVLRFARMCPVPGEAGGRLAMLAKVTGADGAGVTIHRTFLRPDGAKADMDNPRAIMPVAEGAMDGAAVRLAPVADELGIAEGIETALRAGELHNIPTWSCLNAQNLCKFTPPPGIKRLVVFGDNDRSGAGQLASYRLLNRLWTMRAQFEIERIEVQLPPRLGTDWADSQEMAA